MLTTSLPAAAPAITALERSPAAMAASVDASTRAAYHAETLAGAANEAKVAAVTASAAEEHAAARVPDPMSSLSTIAIVGALNSVPATLNMMRSIVMASASGSLTDENRQTLHNEYAQLTQKVASVVGSTSAGTQTQSSPSHDGRKDGNAGDPGQPSGDDRRAPPGRANPAPRSPTHGLHVGTDSYEPRPPRRAQARPTAPETSRHDEAHPQSHRILVAEVAQITQLSQSPPGAPAAPLSAVA